jgi:ribosomal protein L29
MPAKKKQSTTTVAELTTELYVLNMKKFAGELKETHKIKNLRKEIARLKTSI